jgi:hypothetical protein
MKLTNKLTTIELKVHLTEKLRKVNKIHKQNAFKIFGV